MSAKNTFQQTLPFKFNEALNFNDIVFPDNWKIPDDHLKKLNNNNCIITQTITKSSSTNNGPPIITTVQTTYNSSASPLKQSTSSPSIPTTKNPLNNSIRKKSGFNFDKLKFNLKSKPTTSTTTSKTSTSKTKSPDILFNRTDKSYRSFSLPETYESPYKTRFPMTFQNVPENILENSSKSPNETFKKSTTTTIPIQILPTKVVPAKVVPAKVVPTKILPPKVAPAKIVPIKPTVGLTTTTNTTPSATNNYPGKGTGTTKFTIKNNPAIITNPSVINKPKTGPGRLFIFHHDEFQNPTNEYREGSKHDVELLKKTFKHFKVGVTVFENLCLKKLSIQVEKISKEDFSRNSSITFAILSHGNRLETISANDGNYSINDDILFPILRNKTLHNKPKIFIVQACKGDIDLRGYQTDSSCSTKLSRPAIAPDEIYKFYSTTEGFVSYRTSAGSLFIKSFCEEFHRFGSYKNIRDIMELVTKTIKTITNGQQIPSMCVNNIEPYVFGKFV